jgi:hypothetical protein
MSVNRYSDITFSSDGSTFCDSPPGNSVGLWVGDAKGEEGDFRSHAISRERAGHAAVAWDGDQVVFTHVEWTL